jgi:phage protein D
MATATLDHLVAARPVVRVRDQAVSWPYSTVQQLRVEETLDGLAVLEMTLANWGTRDDGTADFLFEDEHELSLGADIAVAFQHADEAVTVFSGRISALEAEFGLAGAPRLTVCAEDRVADLRLRRRSAVYEAMSAGDVCSRLAQDHGLTLGGRTAFGSTQNWVQLGETDLAFMRRLVRRHDLALRLDDREIVVERGAETSAQKIALHVERDLAGLRLRADLAHQCTGVRVTGFDVDSGEAFDRSASQPTSSSGSGRGGAQLLRSAFGERQELLSHLSARSAGEALALAQASLDARAGCFVTAHGKAIGQPQLRVGVDLELQGCGPRFSNVYGVTRCEHRFTLAGGYETSFDACCAWLGEPA